MIGRRAAPVTIRQKWNAGRTQPRILADKRVYTVPRPQQICPGRKEYCTSRQRHLFIPQSLYERQCETAAGRFATNDDAVGGVALCQQKPVGGACVQKAGRKGVFRCKSVFGQEHTATAGFGDV